MAKRFPSHLIRKNTLYTVEELAETLGASQCTVRAWIQQGMAVIDAKRPVSILGAHAKQFLGAKASKSSVSLELSEFLCLRCKRPRAALGGMVDHLPKAHGADRLEALCDVCGCKMQKVVSVAQLPEVAQILDVKTRCKGQA